MPAFLARAGAPCRNSCCTVSTAAAYAPPASFSTEAAYCAARWRGVSPPFFSAAAVSARAARSSFEAAWLPEATCFRVQGLGFRV